MLTNTIIPGKLAKAVAAFCSTEENRPTLRSAVIRRGHLIATNGHILVKTPLFDVLSPVDGTEPVPEYVDHPDWRVSTDVLKGMKVSEYLFVGLGDGKLTKHRLSDGSFLAELPKLEEPEGRYPNADQVIPTSLPVARVAFDPAYLIHVAKLAQAFGWETIAFDLTDGAVPDGSRRTHAQRAVVLRSAHIGPHTTVGLLMPKKLIF